MLGIIVFLLVMRRIKLRDRKKRAPGYTASTGQSWDLNLGLEGSDCKAYPGKIDSCLSLHSRGCLTLGVQRICFVGDGISMLF